MKYKIHSIGLKTLKSGNVKKDANLTAEDGATYEGVTIWPDFYNFANLAEGQTIDGELKTTINGQYTNHVLYNASTAPSASNSGIGANRGGIRGNMSAVIEKKQEGIRESQENKARDIKIATSMQLAVSCALAEYQNPKSLDSIETLIKKYRKFILENWDVSEDVPF